MSIYRYKEHCNSLTINYCYDLVSALDWHQIGDLVHIETCYIDWQSPLLALAFNITALAIRRSQNEPSRTDLYCCSILSHATSLLFAQVVLHIVNSLILALNTQLLNTPAAQYPENFPFGSRKARQAIDQLIESCMGHVTFRSDSSHQSFRFRTHSKPSSPKVSILVFSVPLDMPSAINRSLNTGCWWPVPKILAKYSCMMISDILAL